jgi:hypothetical protein
LQSKLVAILEFLHLGSSLSHRLAELLMSLPLGGAEGLKIRRQLPFLAHDSPNPLGCENGEPPCGYLLCPRPRSALNWPESIGVRFDFARTHSRC